MSGLDRFQHVSLQNPLGIVSGDEVETLPFQSSTARASWRKARVGGPASLATLRRCGASRLQSWRAMMRSRAESGKRAGPVAGRNEMARFVPDLRFASRPRREDGAPRGLKRRNAADREASSD